MENGEGTEKDMKEAIRLYHLSSAQGNSWGQYNLVRIFIVLYVAYCNVKCYPCLLHTQLQVALTNCFLFQIGHLLQEWMRCTEGY